MPDETASAAARPASAPSGALPSDNPATDNIRDTTHNVEANDRQIDPKDDGIPQSQRDLAKTETEIFGENPARRGDGSLMETGIGSKFSQMSPAARANYHLQQAHVAADEVNALAKQLIDAVARLTEANKVAAKSSADAAAQAQQDEAAKQRNGSV